MIKVLSALGLVSLLAACAVPAGSSVTVEEDVDPTYGTVMYDDSGVVIVPVPCCGPEYYRYRERHHDFGPGWQHNHGGGYNGGRSNSNGYHPSAPSPAPAPQHFTPSAPVHAAPAAPVHVAPTPAPAPRPAPRPAPMPPKRPGQF